ncbi:MAG: hypothetical protein MI739_09040 [Bacteroidales bacterium]|nr:hypothetical protein [Bacteroidales bacterium]
MKTLVNILRTRKGQKGLNNFNNLDFDAMTKIKGGLINFDIWPPKTTDPEYDAD